MLLFTAEDWIVSDEYNRQKSQQIAPRLDNFAHFAVLCAEDWIDDDEYKEHKPC
jgi:hypothetical protein